MATRPDDPRLPAGFDLLGRCGARRAAIQFETLEDEPDVVVWIAFAELPTTSGGYGWEACSGMDPWKALYRLLEEVIDGAKCAHCGKASGVDERFDLPQPLPEHVCWYVFDPELKTFRRGCEGETEGHEFGLDRRTGRHVGRNDPCPCGSGEKWKRCHGAG